MKQGMTASKQPNQWAVELDQWFSKCALQTSCISPTWNLLEMHIHRPHPSPGPLGVYFNKLSVIRIHPQG